MILNAGMQKNQRDIKINAYEVQKIVELSPAEFAEFTLNLQDVYNFICEFNKEQHETASGMHAALLVLGEHDKEGVLVDPQGCYYAKYTAYIPNARSIVEQENMLINRYSADLIGVYEELLNIPDVRRITSYFDDYSLQHFKYGVTVDQIEPVYQKALAAIEMSNEEFREQEGRFSYRSEIIGRMRECLLTSELKTGEKVLFVAPEPYGGDADFALRGGVLLSVNSDQKTCNVRSDYFTMKDVPLRYVLGRYDEYAEGEHYGHEKIQPLFGVHPSLAQQYLKEVEETYNMKRNSEQGQDDESAPVLSM